jgi:EAL domain-containing protein (putative c-di-GMP-specific phosphodiesterase class I)
MLRFMEKNKFINPIPYTPMSRHRLNRKITFWVFFTTLALEVAIVSAFYLIFEKNDITAGQQFILLMLLGFTIGTIATIMMIVVIKQLIFSYTAQTINRSEEEHATLSALHTAMKKDELEVYYQPQLNLMTGKIIGMEALIRWNHIEKGFISPSEFIPLAEEAGMIVAIDDWVLNNSCQQNKIWLDQGFNLRVAVNLSALLFKDSNIVETVESALKQSNLPAKNLELEITETAMIKDIENAIVIIDKLRAMGVYISMDDFGTGYSSLSNLDRFPIHKLKIDKIFVRGVNQYSDEPNLADAIIQIGHRLNLKILAEGIETEYQKNYFTKLGCDEGQGYLFSEPIPPQDFAKLLK